MADTRSGKTETGLVGTILLGGGAGALYVATVGTPPDDALHTALAWSVAGAALHQLWHHRHIFYAGLQQRLRAWRYDVLPGMVVGGITGVGLHYGLTVPTDAAGVIGFTVGAAVAVGGGMLAQARAETNPDDRGDRPRAS